MKLVKEVTPQEIHEKYLQSETWNALKRIREGKELILTLQGICKHDKIQASIDDDYSTTYFAARRICLECGKETSKDDRLQYEKMFNCKEILRVDREDFYQLRIN